MIQYMLDTNVCINLMRGINPVLGQRLILIPPTHVAISQIVLYELEFGICKSQQQQRNRSNLLHFLKYVQIIDFGYDQSIMAAKIPVI